MTIRKGTTPRTLTRLLLVCILVAIVFLPPAAAHLSKTPAIDPALQSLASQAGADTAIPVIVQVHGDGDGVKALVQKLGGEIGIDLGFIQAFAARVPANALARLGRDARVGWVSYDRPIHPASAEPDRKKDDPPDPDKLLNTYNFTIGATDAWAEGYTGKGITVAVVDSGVKRHVDLRKRLVRGFSAYEDLPSHTDHYGHGTHIAGIIAGDGKASKGKYVGIAPDATILSVRVCDNQGSSHESRMVAGLQWIYENKDTYNIRVVNVSLNSDSLLSYHQSPLDAALEVLWFNGIVVVVSAGNGQNGIYPPANDPFVITAGAVDERGTPDPSDDVVAPFSGYGTTPDGFSKPDLVAPGVDIVSILANRDATLCKEHPDHKVDKRYFRLSGTSMAAAVTSGAIALLLQAHPDLNPDEVKFRLKASAMPLGQPGAGAGILNVYQAIHLPTAATCNTGVPASQLLWTGEDPVNWGSVNWGSVNWGSVNWGSVNWGSVNWGSVSWGSLNCSSVNWGAAPRTSVNWGWTPPTSVNWGRGDRE